MRQGIAAAVPGRVRDPADGLATTAVQGEGHAQFGTVATKLKTVWTPTRIAGFHRDTASGPTWHTGLPGPAFKQRVVITHEPVNPLHVDRS